MLIVASLLSRTLTYKMVSYVLPPKLRQSNWVVVIALYRCFVASPALPLVGYKHVKNKKASPKTGRKCLILLVGAGRFELPTPCTPCTAVLA